MKQKRGEGTQRSKKGGKLKKGSLEPSYELCLRHERVNAETTNCYLEEFCASYNLKNLIKQPTCSKNLENPTRIDHILIKHPKFFIRQVFLRQDCLRGNFSLVARYSLQNLLVTRCRSCSLQKITRYSFKKITRYSIQNLLATRCKKSLVTRCRNCSLQKITRYLFQNLLVIRCRSCSLQNSLVPRCGSGATFCKFIKVTPAQMLCYECLMQNFKITYCVKHLRTTSSENNIKTSTIFTVFI